MARSFRFALIAAALLSLAELLVPLLAAPVGAVRLPAVRSLAVAGWIAGPVLADNRLPGGARLVQDYASMATGDVATVEIRCYDEPKDALKWTGRLAYEGDGYEQLQLRPVAVPIGAVPGRGRRLDVRISEALMRKNGNMVVIDYSYLDHWGVHAEDLMLWPRAIVDLLARRQGPYCMLGVAVRATRSVRRARDEARRLVQRFVPVLDRVVQ